MYNVLKFTLHAHVTLDVYSYDAILVYKNFRYYFSTAAKFVNKEIMF